MSHNRPIENIPGTILEFALPCPGLDHSFDETVDVFAPVAELSPISRRPSRTSFEASSWRVKPKPWFDTCKPEVFDADLSCDDRLCKVCKEGLYRNKTLFSGGWSRCSLCEDFVHYSCLASGKVSFLKVRPRVCKTCRAAQEGTPSPSPKAATPVAVGS